MQLLAKLPDRGLLSIGWPGDEEAAALADEQDERTGDVAARVRKLAGAREFGDRLPQFFSVHSAADCAKQAAA